MMGNHQTFRILQHYNPFVNLPLTPEGETFIVTALIGEGAQGRAAGT
jgi:hypothetical protein